MAAKDFTTWARPDLVLTLPGHEYRSRPPTLGEIDLLLAIAVRLELEIGLAQGEMPADLAALIEQNAETPVAVISLGQETYDAMVAEKVDHEVIRRMGLYAVLYWARGEAKADVIAEFLWGHEAKQGEGEAGPKDPKGSTSGPSTASESPTSTGSTRTTGSRPSSSRRRPKRAGK